MQVAQITEILNNEKFDSETWNQILPIVYNQLKTIARNVKFGHKSQENLNTTSLVHEAYLKLQKHNNLNVEGTTHFYRLAAMAMRQILVDSARSQLRKKRTKDEAPAEEQDQILAINNQVTTANEMVEIDKALKNLEALSPRLADVVINHFYGGYSFEQIAEISNMSKRTVIRDWKKAKAFIFTQLN